MTENFPRQVQGPLDWFMKVYAPAFLRLAELGEHADMLAKHLPVDRDICPELQRIGRRIADAKKDRLAALGLPLDDTAYQRVVELVGTAKANSEITGEDNTKAIEIAGEILHIVELPFNTPRSCRSTIWRQD